MKKPLEGKRMCCLLAVIFTCFVGYSQQLITIRGTIKDERSNPVPYASVYLLNSNFITATDTSGNFKIKNIPEGNYTLLVSAIGYATINQTIQAMHGAETPLDLRLTDASKQLDEVIVTAEKKEENLQAIPSSISALNAKSVNDYRLWNSKDLTAIVPNLYSANPGDGRNVTSIRGITSSSYDPAVTTYIDGVNQFTLDTYIPQLFDVERIEVLRGPQGTLYGRNAMGGVINIITKQPTNQTSGFLEVNAGNYGEQRYTGAIRTPIVKDKLFFGASLLYEKLDGYYTNEYDNSKFDKQHGIGGNYYLKYLVNDRWSLTFNVKHLANRNYGSFALAPDKDAAFADPFKVNQNAVAKLVDNTFNSSLTANYAGHRFNFSSQTSYQSNYRYYASPIDGDFSPADAITIINNYGNKWNNIKVATEELRFTSPASSASRLKWTAGGYFFYQNVPNKQATHFGKDAALVGSPDSNYAIINTTKARSSGAAVYAQSEYAITKEISIIFGVRYDHQHSKEEVLGEYQPDVSPTPVFETQPDTSASVSYSAFSPRLSIAYHPLSNVDLFASYSRGYRTGGLTQLGADPSQPPLYAYKPEYSNNFELGIKNTFLENRARANISFFYTTITDAQIPTLVLPSAITVTKNAGSLTSKGMDAELAATVLKGLEATYNFGYTDAKYTKLKLSQNGSETDFSGNRQVFTPGTTSFLALQYSISLMPSNKLQLIARGEWTYLGKQYFDLANSITQSPYNLLNARLGLKIKHAELYFWERNIADIRYIAYGYDFGAVHLGNPRTFGFTFKASM
jgi:iron complex outermembrane receptor protein